MVEIGQFARGRVVRVMPYGALVRLDEGSVGLVHISEIADSFVRNIAEYVAADERVVIKVLSCKEGGKFEFSLKQAKDAELEDEELAAELYDSPIGEPETRGAFDEKMRQFMADSSDRLDDIKRHHEEKLGKRGR